MNYKFPQDLPNNCRRSKFNVNPSNWKSKNAKVNHRDGRNLPWRITYRFYDPIFKGSNQWGKLVPLKGMNDIMDLETRQRVTLEIIEDEIEKLNNGYHPITGKQQSLVLHENEASIVPISCNTGIIEALQHAFDQIKVEGCTKIDIKTTLKYFRLSAEMLKKDQKPIKDVPKKELIAILDNCQYIQVILPGKQPRPKIWNENQFNHYCANLSILYNYLENIEEIIDYNPFDKIDPRAPLVAEDKPRITLRPEERILIDDHLQANYPEFHRFVNIFFHSGCREAEILQVQRMHVNLEKQQFKVLVKKGKKIAGQPRHRWEHRTIPDVAMPFWFDVIGDCKDTEGEFRVCSNEEYLFGVGLKPGNTSIRREQLEKRWRVHVKEALKVKADLYSIKHLRSTELKDYIAHHFIADNILNEYVGESNGHTTGAMVDSVYDVKRWLRKHLQIMKIPLSFRFALKLKVAHEEESGVKVPSYLTRKAM